MHASHTFGSRQPEHTLPPAPAVPLPWVTHALACITCRGTGAPHGWAGDTHLGCTPRDGSSGMPYPIPCDVYVTVAPFVASTSWHPARELLPVQRASKPSRRAPSAQATPAASQFATAGVDLAIAMLQGHSSAMQRSAQRCISNSSWVPGARRIALRVGSSKQEQVTEAEQIVVERVSASKGSRKAFSQVGHTPGVHPACLLM